MDVDKDWASIISKKYATINSMATPVNTLRKAIQNVYGKKMRLN